MMKVPSLRLVLCAAALVVACEKGAPPPPARVARHKQRPPAPLVPIAQARAALRNDFRLKPDRRFVLAFSEIARLRRNSSDARVEMPTAEFVDGKWRLQQAHRNLGSLPELPDFSDYLELLVANAREVVGPPRSSAVPTERSASSTFLMPALEGEIRQIDRTWSAAPRYALAARCFARLTFQAADRLEIGAVLPARALALIAISRAIDPRSGVEEEVLLAHATGYTRHAEALARSLPADSPIRLFESLDDESLDRVASRSGASEEARYLSLRRAAASGRFERWKAARSQLFPSDASVAVIATALDIQIPRQIEVDATQEVLTQALPRAILRELRQGTAMRLDAAIAAAAGTAKGPLWDGAASAAYYGSALGGSAGVGNRPTWIDPQMAALLGMADEVRGPKGAMPAPILVARLRDRLGSSSQDYLARVNEIRTIVPQLDSRPSHRAEIAEFSRYSLLDIRAAEDLDRSLLQILGDASRAEKAQSAIYVGDWSGVEDLLKAPQITAPEAAAILWKWHLSGGSPDRLEIACDSLIDRFPSDWDVTNFTVDVLRARKNYRKACEIGENWLRRNTDPRTPGYFHSHVRLSHSYVLAHDYEKALKTLEKTSARDDFEESVRRRETAMCLAGMGSLPEAEASIRQAIRQSPGDPEDWIDLARVLWAEAKNREAAETLARIGLSNWDRCTALKEDFASVMLELPEGRVAGAAAEIARQPSMSNDYRCTADGFGRAGHYDDAVAVLSQFNVSGDGRLDLLMLSYEYRKSSRDLGSASDWLRAQVPRGQINRLSMKAMYAKDDDVLWDVIGTPEPVDHPEWVWLLRACAFALRGTKHEVRRAQLFGYFAGPDRGGDAYRVMARYLLGLATQDEMFKVGESREHRAETAYYLGARAEGESRYRDACEWYRVSVEAPGASGPQTLALWTLSEWAGTGQGISQLREKR